MQTQRKVGTTAENNSWTLPDGMLSVDSEKHAVRIHDGVTPGGFEAVGVKAFDPPPGPGSAELIAGTMDSGLYGEIGPDALISYSDLSMLVGISAGSLVNNNESAWIKVSHFETTLFIAKKPARSGISWSAIDAANAVLGTEVTIGDYRYLVRLLRASDTNPESGAGGELTNIITPLRTGALATYTGTALGTSSGPRWPWAVETVSSNANSRVRYGGDNADYYNTGNNATDSYASATSSYNAWRPVLELIP